METRKLYYEDCHLQTFSATVTECRQAGTIWQIALDATAFYPEGGGQPFDLGTLGGVKVLEVHERDGRVVHTCSGPLAEGSTVEGEIDWERRFDLMQHHSGEHIVSGIAHSMWGCDNVGFHMGENEVILDFDKELTPEEVENWAKSGETPADFPIHMVCQTTSTESLWKKCGEIAKKPQKNP